MPDGWRTDDPRRLTRLMTTGRTNQNPQPRAIGSAAELVIVRVILSAAIVLAVCLSIIDSVQLMLMPDSGPGNMLAGLLATAFAMPLYIRHLIYGTRGVQPPWGMLTLAALTIITAAGAWLAGGAWLRQLAPLAVSCLIIIPGYRGIALAGAVAIAPLFIAGMAWYDQPALSGVYLSLAVVWRTMVQIVPLKLLAALRSLAAANEELRARAVVQTRVHIDAELRSGVGQALERIIARGEVAQGAAQNDPVRAVAELRAMVGESRHGLADARRLVAGYRESSVRAELDAAAALLEAAGAKVRFAAADIELLGHADEQARKAIRTALARTLGGELHSSYRVEVIRNPAGDLAVDITPFDYTASANGGRE
jgi:signal transduction histidine kinase